LPGCETAPKNVPAPKAAVKSKETKPVAAANPATEAAAPAPVISPDVQAYNEGSALYNDGNYNGAIKNSVARPRSGMVIIRRYNSMR
jgi:TolA-binding protein